MPWVARAEGARHQRPDRDAQPDPDRGGEEQDRPGIADRRRQLGLPEHRDEDHVDEIDEEHGHQPDRGRQAHHRHMPQEVSGQELRLHAAPALRVPARLHARP
jgi:hypothetical protein